jgi:hypothetical protein
MSELINLKDGIKINNTYTKQINGIKLYIYVGICNDIPTKWVTQSKWDYKLRIQMNEDRTELNYIDSKNQEVLVYENDEEKWDLF